MNPIDHQTIVSGNAEIGTENSGIKVVTDVDGFFELKKVPTGSYYLVAKTNGYLSSQFPGVTVFPGDIQVGINPTFNNAAIPDDLGELQGGDVSSGDAPGVQDDRVDEDDINFLDNNSGTVDPAVLANGDINGDGAIDGVDIIIASSNFLAGSNEGIPPIGNKRSGGDNGSATLSLKGVPEVTQNNQEFVVSVWAENVDDLFGYIYTLDFDPAQVELVENEPIVEGDFLKTRQGENRTIFFDLAANVGRKIINVLLGVNGKFVTGSGVITEVHFRALADDIHPDIRLLNVKVANSEVDIARLSDTIQIPDEFGLAQNYPNPFNPVTNIRFELPRTSDITLKIYNVVGQEIASLVNTELTAGFHKVVWNGRNSFGRPVASGIYYYRLTTPEFTQTKRMLLIK